MQKALVIRGRLAQKTFVSDDPMPDVEGPAELIVYAEKPMQGPSVSESAFGVFGKAEQLRSADDIESQLQDERGGWNGA